MGYLDPWKRPLRLTFSVLQKGFTTSDTLDLLAMGTLTALKKKVFEAEPYGPAVNVEKN